MIRSPFLPRCAVHFRFVVRINTRKPARGLPAAEQKIDAERLKHEVDELCDLVQSDEGAMNS